MLAKNEVEMFSLALFDEMYPHMHWADADVWKVVLAHSDAEADKKLKATLYHSHLTQLAFFKIWTAAPMQFPAESDFVNLQALCKWAFETAEKQDRYLQHLNQEDLDEPLHIPWQDRFAQRIGRKPANGTLGDALLQVPMHSQHHRGQVCSNLRGLGAEPPLVDFIVWIWSGRPAVSWPDVAKANR